METKKSTAAQHDQKKQNTSQENTVPKPESSSEYEGAPSRKPTGNPPVEEKTETSSSSGQ